MKLSSVDFYIDWPVSIEVKNLRKYLMANLVKKGDVIRWSIIDIQNPIDSCGTKKLRIKAVLANEIRI
tara:strand:+ start:21 stop:224 length:204 start_codon:yes stop_codon:yes gene_type:complete